MDLIDDRDSTYRRCITIGRGYVGDSDDMIVCSKEYNTIDLKRMYPDKTLISKEWIDDCICNYEIVKKETYLL